MSPDQAALDTLIAAAKKEGELTLYSANVDSTINKMVDGFKAAYGITVNHPPRSQTAAMLTRFNTETDAGSSPADILESEGRPEYDDMLAKGRILSLDAQKIPFVADYPKAFKTAYSIHHQASKSGLCYNTDQIKPADLTKWADLGNAKVHMLYPDPALTPVYAAQWANIISNGGIVVLQNIAKNQHKVVASTVPGFELLTAGEGNVLLGCPLSLAQPAIDKKAPIGYIELSPTTGYEFGIAIPTKAPHPNAARLYAYWLTTKAGQVATNAGISVAPAFPQGVDGTLPIGAYVGFDQAAVVAQLPAIKAALGF
ncbi:MAG: extracellular solute-binding protein [Actinomycetota bacterium]